MPDVVILGGGVIGCATALYLAKSGADVLVLERGEIGGEASGAAAGMLASLSGEAGEHGPGFAELCAASLVSYESLVPELAATGIDIRHHRTGILHLALTQPEVAPMRQRFDYETAHGATPRWFDRDDLLREEPQLNPSAIAGYLTSGEQYVDPQRLTQALAAAAHSAGARIETNTPLTRFVRVNARVTAVHTPRGRFECASLLLAAGPWTFALARRLGARIPVRPVRGQMLSLDGPAQPLRHMVWSDHAYLVPREDGQTYIGATVEDVGYRKHNTRAGVAGLRSGAAAIVPSLAAAPQRRAWAGLRPASLDGRPIMGRLPGWSNVWVSTGHFRNGILMAPASGELMAQSMLSGSVDPLLAPFTPKRFLD